MAAADVQWVRRVRAGVGVTVAAYLVYALAGFTIQIVPPRVYDLAVFWTAGLLEVLGVWWVSTPEPDVGRMRDPRRQRQLLRTLAVIAGVGRVVGSVAVALGGMSRRWPGVMERTFVIGLVLCAAWPAATALFYGRLADLMRRVPGGLLHRQAVVIGWGLATGIASFLWGVVGLIFRRVQISDAAFTVFGLELVAFGLWGLGLLVMCWRAIAGGVNANKAPVGAAQGLQL